MIILAPSSFSTLQFSGRFWLFHWLGKGSHTQIGVGSIQNYSAWCVWSFMVIKWHAAHDYDYMNASCTIATSVDCYSDCRQMCSCSSPWFHDLCLAYKHGSRHSSDGLYSTTRSSNILPVFLAKIMIPTNLFYLHRAISCVGHGSVTISQCDMP